MKTSSFWFQVSALMILVPSAQAAIDQQYVPATTNGRSRIANTIDVAQTFTVGITGILTGFDAWVSREADTTLPLLFDIRRTLGGLPTESDFGPNVLAAGSVDAQQIPIYDGILVGSPPSILPHVELNGLSFPVAAGEVLAIVLRTDAPGPNDTFAYNWRFTSGEYLAGVPYFRTSAGWRESSGGTFGDRPNDRVFRTYVNEVPEAAALPLLLMSGFSVLGIRRR